MLDVHGRRWKGWPWFLAGAAAALAFLVLVPAAGATYEGLANPGLEGAAATDNGFRLYFDPPYTMAQQVEAVPGACDTSPLAPPQAGLVRTGACAINVGAPGPTTPWAAVQSVKMYPKALGNSLAQMSSFSAFHNVPNGVSSLEINVRYQFYYRIDTNDDSVYDKCIVQQTGFVNPPVEPAATAGWEPVTFSSTDPSVTFYDYDGACSDCADGPGTCTFLTQPQVQTKYPTARILQLIIQLAHTDPGSGYPDWQPGYPVYFDDFQLTMNESPGVLLQVDDGVAVSEEGPTGDTYYVSLSAPPAGGETVTVTPDEDPGASTPDQLSIAPTTLSFTAGDWSTPKPVTVTAIDDPLAETQPHFTTIKHTVASSNLLSPFNAVTVPSFGATIADNDLAGVNPFPKDIVLTEADPAATASFDVALGSPPGPGETVTVLLVPDARETLDTDTLSAGDQHGLNFTSSTPMSLPVAVTVVDDAIDQVQHDVAHISGTVSTNVPTSPYVGVLFPDVNITVGDNDPFVRIDATAAGSEEGPAGGLFTVTRWPDVSRDLLVNYTVSTLSTATAGPDYDPLYPGASGTILIPAGSASKTLSVSPVDDAADEPTETVVVDLNLTTEPYDATGPTASASVDILDNDDPVLTIAATLAADEAGPTPGQFTLSRTTTDLAIDVDYAVSGTALPGTDFTLDVPPPVHFDPGQGTATLSVDPVDDALDEPPETVIVTLAAGTGYLVGVPDADTVTIGDNDLPEVSVSVPLPTADETGPVDGGFTLTRTAGDLSAPLDVQFALAGLATDGADFGLIGGMATIPAGLDAVDVPVATVDDAEDEPTETVVLTLLPDAAYNVAPPPDDSGTVTIADNDDPSVWLSVDTGVAAEAGPTSADLVAARSNADLAIDVDYALAGTATLGLDYTASPSTPLHFDPGQLTATLTIAAIDDAIDEMPETADATLLAGAGYTLASPLAGSVTIADNDVPLVTVVATTAAADEAGPAAGVFTLSRDNADLDLTVSVDFSGTATAGADYPAPPATLSFLAGEFTVTYTLVPTADGMDEAPETADLALLAGPDYAIGVPGVDTVTIADGDPPVALDDLFAAYADCASWFPAPGVLANDPVPTGLTYAALPFSGPTSGSGWVALAADGSFSYAPALGFLGTDTFSYRDTDGTYDSLPATVFLDVKANTLPAAGFAMSATTVMVHEGVTLSDTSTDLEGPLTGWAWTFGDGYSGGGPTAVHAYDTPGSYAITLLAYDGQCGWAYATKGITVIAGSGAAPPEPDPIDFEDEGVEPPVETLPPPAPTAEAGADQFAAAGSLVSLAGTGTGSGPLSFQWAQLAGPALDLQGATTASPSFTAPAVDGTNPVRLWFSLVVMAGGQASTADIVSVTVASSNGAPHAAASATDAPPGSLVVLDGSGATDPDGDTLSYKWVQWSGPGVVLQGAASAKASFVVPDVAAGTPFKFGLEVSDGHSSDVAVVEAHALAGGSGGGGGGQGDGDAGEGTGEAPHAAPAAGVWPAWGTFAVAGLVLVALVALLALVLRRR